MGFQHIEKKTLADVEAIDGRFDYYCWDLYARVGDFYAADPARKELQAETLHAIEAGGNETARLAEHVAARIVDCHLATMERLGIRYDLLAHESDILRLHFWDRAFELLKESGRDPPGDRGQERGLLGAADGRGRRERPSTRTRSSSARTAPSPTPARTSPTSSGSSAGSTATSATAATARYPDGHVLWSTTSGDGEAGAPRLRPRDGRLQRHRRRPVLSAARGEGGRGRARPRRGGGRAATTSPTRRSCSRPPPRAPSATTCPEDETAVKVSGRKGLGREGRRPRRRPRRQGARRDRRPRPRARRRRARGRGATAVATGALRYFLLKFGRTQDHHVRHGGGAGLHGRDRALHPERGRARPQHLRASSRPRGTASRTLLERARRLGPRRAFLSGEEGDEVWSLLLLMARTEEVAEQAIRAEEVALAGQARLRRRPGLPLATTRSRSTRVLHAESEDLRACRTLVVDAFVRADGGAPAACSASPCPSACDASRPVVGITLGRRRRAGPARDARGLRPLGRAGGRLPVVLPPARPDDAGRAPGPARRPAS